MRKVKRIFALLLAMVMTLSLGITALAADNGTITITNATKGETYKIYKIFDATVSKTTTDGEEKTNVSYTIPDGSQIANSDVTVTVGEGDAAVTYSFAGDVNNKAVFHTSANGGKTYVTIAADVDNAVVIAWLKAYIESLSNDTAAMEQTATGDTVTFTGLDYGYYYVTSSLGSVVTIDSAAPTATVIDKNQTGPSWEEEDGFKTIVKADGTTDKISANYGDEIKFQIQFDATNYDGEKGIVKYTITDTLAKGLSYVMENSKINMTVTVQGASESTAKTLTVDKDYTVEVENVLDDDSQPTGEQKFTLNIDWQNKTDNKYNGTFLYESPSTITVTYFATVTDEAAIAGEGNKNTATISYTKDDGDEGGGGDGYTDTATTYTYALALKKIDAATKAPLAGAEFTLVDSDGNAVYVVSTDVPGVYEFSSKNTTNTTNSTTTVTSPANGVIIIKGVAADTYTLTEIKAPDGYNLLTTTKDIAAVMESANYTTYKYDENGNLLDKDATNVSYEVSTFSIEVENASGSELPSTGGMGTTIFYVLGGILVLGAVVLLITKRRMNAEK